MSRASAILSGLCPRCRKGKIFQKGFTVYPKCSECGLSFNREHGYFLGAMYMEYFLGAVFLGVACAALRHFWTLSLFQALGIAFVLFLPFIPFTIRLSRTLWIYWDNAADPQ